MNRELRQQVTAAEIQRDFRRLNPEHDQWLRGKSADEIHGNGEWMAPGGPFLAQLMADRIAPKCGERILDLGCGRGQSSVFLAARYGVQVVSVDLWVPAEERNARAAAAGAGSRVVSLQGDIRLGLPADFRSFDAIFCLQAFHCFGTTQAMLRYLAALLKPGGRLCFARPAAGTRTTAATTHLTGGAITSRPLDHLRYSLPRRSKPGKFCGRTMCFTAVIALGGAMPSSPIRPGSSARSRMAKPIRPP